MRPAPLLLSLILAGGTWDMAAASETACWFENGAVVVPAEIGGVAGDWLLDPSSPRTLLHETRAQMEGLPEVFTAPAHIAGRRIKALEVRVADLDDRAPGFPTPIAGIIGADLLARFTADLDFAPCRLRLDRPGGARPRDGERLPLHLIAGVPAVEAGVADDRRRADRGLFALDWSGKAAVRLSGAALEPPSAQPGPTPRNQAPGRLRALSVGGRLYEEQSAALADGLDPRLAGALGTDFWARWRLRLDISRGRLWLSPK